jgi:RimJ/RimL family protein N-acetyltransferase
MRPFRFRSLFAFSVESTPLVGEHRTLALMSKSPTLTIRDMQLDDVNIRINYFHDATDEHLSTLGVDRSLLMSKASWTEFYREDYARPLEQRLNFSLIWEVDGETVGFSSTDRIRFGEEAFMHLHILDPTSRHQGLGTTFVRLSALRYMEVLQLRRLYCEPNAFNVAPNRTLQRAGFHYLFSHEAQPSSMNTTQVTTRWLFESSSPAH